MNFVPLQLDKISNVYTQVPCYGHSQERTEEHYSWETIMDRRWSAWGLGLESKLAVHLCCSGEIAQCFRNPGGHSEVREGHLEERRVPDSCASVQLSCQGLWTKPLWFSGSECKEEPLKASDQSLNPLYRVQHVRSICGLILERKGSFRV